MSDRFVIAVVADLGGRHATETGRLRRVDRDSIGAWPARLGVSVEVPDGDGPARLEITSLDDFHPDALVRNLPGLARLRASPSAAPRATASSPVESRPPELRPPAGAGLLESILRTSEGAPPIDTGVGEFARRVSEPFVVRPSAPADTAALAAAVRAVLYDDRFHELEAAWRGLHDLVMATDDASGAEIWVLDATPADAPAMLADELSTPGAPPAAALLAAFRYGPDDLALAALAGLAAVAQATSIPLIADVDPRVIGLDDARTLGTSDATSRIGMIDHWRRLRRHALAAHVLLCMPRVLGRLPYGPHGEPVSAFPFDETLRAADHERFLWTSAALAFGSVLATAFAADGWTMHLEHHAQLAGLPVYVSREPDGTSQPIPCAEVVMSTTTIRAVIDQGMTVLASVRDEDRAAFWGIGMLDGSPLPDLG